MTHWPSVSVIVPVYNGAGTIEETIDSLFAMDYPRDRLEIIVVDNGSTDDTRAIVGRYDGRLRLHTEPRRGPAAARNRGIAASCADVVAFTDADCVVDPGWLRELVQPLGDATVGIVGGAILARRPCNRIEAFGDEIHDHRRAIDLHRPPYAISMNWASPRHLLTHLGGFDPSLLRCEDVDLSHRIAATGHRLVFSPQATVYHRNERSFPGLFNEGFRHGFHAVARLKKHRALVPTEGHRRFNARPYRALARGLVRSIAGPDRHQALCYCVFNFGKRLGKLSGSIRFAELDL